MKTPSINAIKQAADDGRLELWVNFDGDIIILNTHTGKEVIVDCSRSYDGTKDSNG